MSDESFMHAAGESHDCIVLTKAPNKDAPRSAEGLEGRQSIKENIGSPTRAGRRVGKSGHGDCPVCGKQQRRIRGCSVPPCCIM